MSNKTKEKRRTKKYQGPKNVRWSFGRTHGAFGPIIDFFERQIKDGTTLVDQRGVPSILTMKNTLSPTWEAIEAMLDLAETAKNMGIMDVPVAELEAYKRSLKHGVLVPQTLFKQAYEQLLVLRNKTFALPAKIQVSLAENTQIRQLIQITPTDAAKVKPLAAEAA